MRDYIQLAVDKAAADPEARTESLCDCSRKKGLPQDLIEMLTGYKQVACAPHQPPALMHAAKTSQRKIWRRPGNHAMPAPELWAGRHAI